MDFDAWIKTVQTLPLPGLTLGGLSVEFTVLALSIVLGLVQLLVSARMVNGQRGLAWNLGARDGEPPSVSPLAGRLDRAYRNFMETFPFLVAAILAADATGRLGWMTLVGSQVYLLARIVYIPLYAAGVPAIRTIVWLISILGLGLVIAALFVEPSAV